MRPSSPPAQSAEQALRRLLVAKQRAAADWPIFMRATVGGGTGLLPIRLTRASLSSLPRRTNGASSTGIDDDGVDYASRSPFRHHPPTCDPRSSTGGHLAAGHGAITTRSAHQGPSYTRIPRCCSPAIPNNEGVPLHRGVLPARHGRHGRLVAVRPSAGPRPHRPSHGRLHCFCAHGHYAASTRSAACYAQSGISIGCYDAEAQSALRLMSLHLRLLGRASVVHGLDGNYAHVPKIASAISNRGVHLRGEPISSAYEFRGDKAGAGKVSRRLPVPGVDDRIPREEEGPCRSAPRRRDQYARSRPLRRSARRFPSENDYFPLRRRTASCWASSP